MSNLLLYIIILISTSLSLEKLKENNDDFYIELPKYGKVEFETLSWLYLDLKDFKKGDIIYLELVFTTFITFFNDVPLLISETNNYKQRNSTNEKRLTDNKCMQEIDGYTVDHSCRYEYELLGDFRYLTIITPDFQIKYYMIGAQSIEHTRGDLIVYIIIGIIIGILVVVFIIIYIIWIRKKFRRMNLSNNDNSKQLVEKNNN